MKPLHSNARSLRRPLAFTAFALFSAAMGAACGVDNALVGGTCASGFTECDLTCVDTTDDSANCGACGNVCPDSACVNGHCLRRGDGNPPDGSADAVSDGHETEKSPSDGSMKESSTKDGPTSDVTTRDAPSEATKDACVPPFDTPDNCGACGLACSSVDVCDLSDAGTYQCVPLCSAPETDCNGACVDTTTDANNCGRCGKVCATGICSASTCQGTTAGDIVVIGDDYHSKATVPSGVRVLTNAVFLPTSYPVQLLSFEHYADPVSVANIKAALSAEAALTGHKIDITVSNTDTDIPNDLVITKYDVLLVYDQEAADPGVLGALGTSWASTLATFTTSGGMVVSLDGAAGATQEMPMFDTNAGLLAVSAHAVILPNTALDVVASSDAVGHGVTGPYAAKPDSVFFTTSEANGGDVTYVVVDTGLGPVVVHKAAQQMP